MMKNNNQQSAVLVDEPEPDSPTGDLTIDTSIVDKRWQPLVAELQAHGQFVWQALALPACELSLVLDNDAAVQQLNHSYRDKNKPTNVLSFPALDFAQPATSDDFPAPPILLGDIIMAYETLAREADEGAISLTDHARHLLTHGLLHLLGYDHQDDAQASHMEQLEVRLLAQCGIANPYLNSTTGDLS
jgi:probable rRNA maturation factor